jgi:poly(3-hydroxybutyrate) depolymerase
VFNGSRFRAEITPKIAAFMQQNSAPMPREITSTLGYLTAASADNIDAEAHSPMALIASEAISSSGASPEMRV